MSFSHLTNHIVGAIIILTVPITPMIGFYLLCAPEWVFFYT